MRVDPGVSRRRAGPRLGLAVVPVALAVVLAGCGGRALEPGPDGGSDGPADAAACGCGLEADAGLSPTLTMSWDCYCATFGCERGPGSAVCAAGHFFSACGLEFFTIETAGGPETWVFDASGALVGAELGSDSSEYSCPSDPSVRSYRLRAGRFPDPSCAMVECPCADGGAACGLADGGTDR